MRLSRSSALLWLTLARALTARATPATLENRCDACTGAWAGFREEWLRLEPEIVADVPPALCAHSSTPSLCQSAVTAGLHALGGVIVEINGTSACELLRLCPLVEQA